MIKIAVGHSEDVDSQDAITEIIHQCQKELGDLSPKGAILFAAIEHDHPVLLKTVKQAWPDVDLIGCSTDGEASSHIGFTEDSVMLIVFAGDLEVQVGIGRDIQNQPREAAQVAMKEAWGKMKTTPQLGMIFPDGLTFFSDELIQGLQAGMPTIIPIYGGGAGEQYRWTTTYQFYQEEILTDGIPVLLLGGNLLFSHGVSSGWKAVSPYGIVTKAEGNDVHEIDHQPALSFYRRFFGRFAFPTREYPFAVLEPGSKKYAIKAALNSDEATGMISFSGIIPEGRQVRLCEATRNEIIEGSQDSIEQALEHFPNGQPDFVFLFSCAARRGILGTRTKEELELVQSLTETHVSAAGFYAYGEFCPLTEDQVSQFHNGTFVTLCLGSSSE